MTGEANSPPVALVTGGGRGIGRGIAIELGKLKHKVVINYASDATAAEECLRLVRESGGDGIIACADISSSSDRKLLVQAVIDAYGRIDLLVNNAGIAPAQRADLLEASEESFDRLINVHLKGTYFLTQRVARQMVEQVMTGMQGCPSRIVTITSSSAYAVSVDRGEYCVAKAGLSMMTALFAMRLAEFGINVYELRPGVIATDMTEVVRDKYDKLIEQGVWPIRRWGEPIDVGRAVAAIARGDFPYSTGEVINVDGGFHLRKL